MTKETKYQLFYQYYNYDSKSSEGEFITIPYHNEKDQPMIYKTRLEAKLRRI